MPVLWTASLQHLPLCRRDDLDDTRSHAILINLLDELLEAAELIHCGLEDRDLATILLVPVVIGKISSSSSLSKTLRHETRAEEKQVGFRPRWPPLLVASKKQGTDAARGEWQVCRQWSIEGEGAAAIVGPLRGEASGRGLAGVSLVATRGRGFVQGRTCSSRPRSNIGRFKWRVRVAFPRQGQEVRRLECRDECMRRWMQMERG
ncbi:hypothetical protein MRB53_040759 [Persea americana]|nr:hypothetical protein MRB53_040759 [Persea americana]